VNGNVIVDGNGHAVVGGALPIVYTSDLLGGLSNSYASAGFLVSGSGSTIKNFGNINFGSISNYTYDIELLNDNNTVQNNTMDGGATGVYVSGSSNTITGNTIRNTSGDISLGNPGGGVYIVSGTGNIVSNNTLSNNHSGGVILGTAGNTLTGNSAWGNRLGNYRFNSDNFATAFTNTIDATNLSDGNPVYFLSNISNQTYDGNSLGKLGMFWCNNCTNVTLQNVTFSTSTDIAVVFYNATSTTIQNNTIEGAGAGVYIKSATTTVVSGNVFRKMADTAQHNISVLLFSAYDNTVSNNLFDTLWTGVKLSASTGTNTINGNTFFASQNTFTNQNGLWTDDGLGTTSYTNNRINEPVGTSTQMINVSDGVRTYNVGDTINFSADLYDVSGNSCSSCTYTAVTYPSETVTASKTGNTVSGSFSPTKAGTYALVITATDSGGNTEQKTLHYFVGSTASRTQRAYMRSLPPMNGGVFGNGTDSQIMNFTAPTDLEAWWCSGWVQQSLDVLPPYPLAMVTELNSVMNVRTQSATNYVGIQRFGLYVGGDGSGGNGFGDSVAAVTLATTTVVQTGHDFTSLAWGMDSPQSWRLSVVKFASNNNDFGNGYPRLYASSTAPSYVDYTYSYPTTVPVYSSSNDTIHVMSATAPSDATTTAAVTLNNPITTATSTDLVITSLSRPFIGATSTIDTTGTTTVTATIAAGGIDTFNAASMDITPSGGSITTTVSNWATTTHAWTESSATHAATASHVISNLTPNTDYHLFIDGVASTTYTSDGSGVISFTYSGGYSTHTFSLTSINAPTLTTSAATAISTSTAAVHGTITDTGGEDASQSGFAYGTDSALATVIATSTLGSQSGTASFSQSITGLSPNTTYYVRAYAANSTGTGLGSIQSFTTQAITAPTALTSSGSAISPSGFTMNGSIASDGNASSTVRGFQYGATTAYGATTTESGIFGAGAFSATLSSLPANVAYHYRAYATNPIGTSYGSDTTVSTDPPAFSSVSATPSSNSAAIAWTTDGAADSQVAYGPTALYGATTTLDNTLATSHNVSLTGLIPCALYHFQIISAGTRSADRAFTTTDCTGSATIASSQPQQIATSTGGTLTLSSVVTLTVPALFSTTTPTAAFQALSIDPTSFFTAAGRPSGKQSIGSTVVTLKALTSATTTVTAFDQPLQVTLSYSPSDVSGIDPSMLAIYRYDSGNWTPLSNCTTDTGAHTVTCDTSHFSDFALFGPQIAASASTAASNGPIAGSSFVSLAPYTPLPGVPAATPTAPVLSTPSSCSTYLTAYIKLGKQNDATQVTRLQTFLNTYEGEHLAVTGTYDTTTEQAVERFQTKYAADVLAPWGETAPTGYVYTTTERKINAIVCAGAQPAAAAPSSAVFTRSLYFGIHGDDVVQLQRYLISHGYLATGNDTGYFGPLTAAAVERFQVDNQITGPGGEGYGVVGPRTRGALSAL
jgi:parallel beta-helix repeat protein